MDISPLINAPPPSPSYTTTSNLWQKFSSMFSWPMWVIIVLILSLLGFNVFTYLAEGTRQTSGFFAKTLGTLLKMLGFEILDATEQTVSVSKKGVDVTADAVTDAIDDAKRKVVGRTASGTIKGAPNSSVIGGPERQQADPIEQALKAAPNNLPEPEPATGGAGGWCYIGDGEPNERVCASAGVNDTCMSGSIFPSQEICVNPELRP